jgi:hypothetical protein
MTTVVFTGPIGVVELLYRPAALRFFTHARWFAMACSDAAGGLITTVVFTGPIGSFAKAACHGTGPPFDNLMLRSFR